MRVAILAEFMCGPEPPQIVAALAALVELATARRVPQLQIAIEALTQVLSDPVAVSYPIRRDLYEAAVAANTHEIARMLFEGPEPRADSDAEEPRPLRPRGRPLTLGERKSLARGHRRDVLEPLLRDPHPEVVRILLGNPHLTERDVLVIATHRSTPPAALAQIASNTRWIARYAVKRALILNPHTPVQLAVRLAVALELRDLKEVVADETLPQPLRDQAGTLLQRTRRPSRR